MLRVRLDGFEHRARRFRFTEIGQDFGFLHFGRQILIAFFDFAEPFDGTCLVAAGKFHHRNPRVGGVGLKPFVFRTADENEVFLIGFFRVVEKPRFFSNGACGINRVGLRTAAAVDFR